MTHTIERARRRAGMSGQHMTPAEVAAVCERLDQLIQQVDGLARRVDAVQARFEGRPA